MHAASPDRLRRDLAAADWAYRDLAPNNTRAYNKALNSITRDVDLTTPAILHSELRQAGVRIDEPAVKLPLFRYHAVRTSPGLTNHWRLAPRSYLSTNQSRLDLPARWDVSLCHGDLPARAEPTASFLHRRRNNQASRWVAQAIRSLPTSRGHFHAGAGRGAWRRAG